MKIYIIVDDNGKPFLNSAAPSLERAVDLIESDMDGLDTPWAELYADGYRIAVADLNIVSMMAENPIEGENDDEENDDD